MSPSASVVLTVPMLPPRRLGPSAAPADYLEADAVVTNEARDRAQPGGPFEFKDVRVENGQVAGDWVVMGERSPDNRLIEDLWGGWRNRSG